MKNFSKKGFSLLEVMLAVAIMAVTSSMIMYGFLASMNYANNSSIYARVAAANSRGCYFRMGELIARTDRAQRYELVDNVAVSSRSGIVNLEGGPLPTDGSADLKIGGFDFTTDYSAGHPGADSATFDVASIAVPLDSAYGDSLEAGSGGYQDATVADNRTSFFYTIPDTTFPYGTTLSNGRCPICNSDYQLAMYRRGNTQTYHWVCVHWQDPDHETYKDDVLAAW